MGGWILEGVKMTGYMIFPVAGFYILNQPVIFDNLVKQEPRPKSLENLTFLQKIKEKYKNEELEKAKGNIVLL